MYETTLEELSMATIEQLHHKLEKLSQVQEQCSECNKCILADVMLMKQRVDHLTVIIGGGDKSNGLVSRIVRLETIQSVWRQMVASFFTVMLTSIAGALIWYFTGKR